MMGPLERVVFSWLAVIGACVVLYHGARLCWWALRCLVTFGC